MPLTRHILSLLAVVTSLVALPALRADQGEIIRELDAPSVEQILAAMKMDYTQIKPGIYSFSLGGYKTLLFNKGKNIQFYASFKKRVPLTRINEWNAGKRYTRAYLDKDGDPVLEADLDLEGGVSPRALLEFIKMWVTSVQLFTQHIGFQSGSATGSGA
jgi:hypothetical protein